MCFTFFKSLLKAKGAKVPRIVTMYPNRRVAIFLPKAKVPSDLTEKMLRMGKWLKSSVLGYIATVGTFTDGQR